jgi:hypothetical protein
LLIKTNGGNWQRDVQWLIKQNSIYKFDFGHPVEVI